MPQITIANNSGANNNVATETDSSTNHHQKVVLWQLGTVPAPIARKLDVDGDGTGNSSMNVNHSGAEEEYFISPAASTVNRIKRLILVVVDGTGGLEDEFGNLNAALTNGIKIQVKNGSGEVYDLIDDGATGLNGTIKTNGDLMRLATDFQKIVEGTSDIIRATFDFEAMFGFPIRLDQTSGEYLAVSINDDLSGLTEMSAFVTGFVEA